MNRQAMNGFTLVIVLLFLQLFSLLGWTLLTSTSMTIKVNAHRWQHQENVYWANQILTELELDLLLMLPDCRVPITPWAMLTREPFTWWQQHGCSGNLNEIRYYYVVEWLDKDPCGVIDKDEKNQGLIANYYRITLLVSPKKMKAATILFQSTVAKGAHDTSSCRGQLHNVTLGRQMRREWIGRKALEGFDYFNQLKR